MVIFLLLKNVLGNTLFCTIQISEPHFLRQIPRHPPARRQAVGQGGGEVQPVQAERETAATAAAAATTTTTATAATAVRATAAAAGGWAPVPDSTAAAAELRVREKSIARCR